VRLRPAFQDEFLEFEKMPGKSKRNAGRCMVPLSATGWMRARSLILVVAFFVKTSCQSSTESDIFICSQLNAKLSRLHAEIASVRAELASLCSLPSDRAVMGGMAVEVSMPLPSPPTRSSATADDAGGRQPTTHETTERFGPVRRSGEPLQYATQCWAPGSTFADPSCNCLGKPAHPRLGSRRTVKVIVASW
jgi:hypothetical protein